MTKKQVQVLKTPKRNLPQYYKIIALVIIVIAAVYFILVYTGGGQQKNDEEYMFRKDGELSFADTSGKITAKIDIQIAKTEFDRELGLMYRKNMDESQGMLFIFPDSQVRNFWMRNTLIPLDMLFINDSKIVLNIAKNTTPYSDMSYSSAGPAKYVLEVNGGFTDRHNITKGAIVSWISTP